MSLNNTPRANRVHISFFGKRNAGKSSLINAITGQETAIVSDVLGTTTDPVFKTMEILPIGPCVLIDTAGLDDVGTLGALRIKKTFDVLNKTDVAVFITDSANMLDEIEKEILDKIKAKKIPIIFVINKVDILNIENEMLKEFEKEYGVKPYKASSHTREGIDELKLAISKSIQTDDDKFKIVGDLVDKGDFVILVTPIDSSAPKGRIILPQQQVVRDLLENDVICIVIKENDIKHTLAHLNIKPKLVITDSQAFEIVNRDLPKDIPLTSFSILFARLKGELDELIKGANIIEHLKDGDKILIAEACTHHIQSEDIGRVKIPNWLKKKTGKNLIFEYSAGYSYKEDLKKYVLIIHCGACMLNRREMMYRIELAKNENVPIINYGIIIAYMNGILQRAIAPLIKK
jgi:[FeFe] hydrogenase H-cluster maturation GTPase HydF